MIASAPRNTDEVRRAERGAAEEKPLFVALAGAYYDAFERGEKTVEYRVHGPRWNERTCRPGRPVVLSRGYGRARRLTGVITGFHCVGPDADPAIRHVYPVGDVFSAITIMVIR